MLSCVLPVYVDTSTLLLGFIVLLVGLRFAHCLDGCLCVLELTCRCNIVFDTTPRAGERQQTVREDGYAPREQREEYRYNTVSAG